MLQVASVAYKLHPDLIPWLGLSFACRPASRLQELLPKGLEAEQCSQRRKAGEASGCVTATPMQQQQQSACGARRGQCMCANCPETGQDTTAAAVVLLCTSRQLAIVHCLLPVASLTCGRAIFRGIAAAAAAAAHQ
jgi:hypothetical protein